MSIINSSLSMVIKSDSVLAEKTIVDNGEYDANQEGYDGYSRVDVDVTDFTKIDGVNYNINGTNPVLENGRFWTKWEKKSGLIPVDSTGAYIAPDWTQDWEIGTAFMFKGTVPVTRTTIAIGCSTLHSFNPGTPIVYLNYPNLPNIYARMYATTSATERSWKSGISFNNGIQADTWYFIKLVYNSATKTMVVSATTDFENWATDQNPTILDDTPYSSVSYKLGFGSGNQKDRGEPEQNVILDLANSYVKQNNIMIWGNFDGKFSDKYTSQEVT